MLEYTLDKRTSGIVEKMAVSNSVIPRRVIHTSGIRDTVLGNVNTKDRLRMFNILSWYVESSSDFVKLKSAYWPIREKSPDI
jgi:hypothetical protein